LFHDRKRQGRPGVLDAFRFESFFFEPWTGRGVVKDRLGLVLGTYEARGGGRVADGRIFIEHAHTFSNGIIQHGEWEILESQDGRVTAYESAYDITGKGWPTDRGYRWTYLAKMPTSFGMRLLRTSLLYTMTGPGEARSSGSVGLWGLPLTTLTGEFRQAKD
jgi:hypothetical protein